MTKKTSDAPKRTGKLNIQKLRTNFDARRNGVWIPITRKTGFTVDTNARMKIAASNTGDFKRAQAEVLQKARESGVPPTDEELAAITAELLADYCVRDWEGDDICDGDEPLPYSRENAIRLFTEVEVIREWVTFQTDNAANFTEARVKELEGN